MRGALFLAAALALSSDGYDEPFVVEVPMRRLRGRWAVEATSTVKHDSCLWIGRQVTRHRSLSAARSYARRTSGRHRVAGHDTIVHCRVRHWRREVSVS